ncbi:MAG: ribbon-helix-helix domain-containing protein [Chloroflexi bacterium]|nr:ribbon-helix-helix domain-containing protein [Chloroflexota bacterium]
MPKETLRTHVVIPRQLIESIDEFVGRRRRSKFMADAVREKLARVRLARAAEKAAGSLADVDIPGWENSESAAQWVRSCRREDEERLGGKQVEK